MHDDNVMTSADMTIMSGKGLNVTGLMTQKNKKSFRSKKDGGSEQNERMDTDANDDDEELDLQAIE